MLAVREITRHPQDESLLPDVAGAAPPDDDPAAFAPPVDNPCPPVEGRAASVVSPPALAPPWFAVPATPVPPAPGVPPKPPVLKPPQMH